MALKRPSGRSRRIEAQLLDGCRRREEAAMRRLFEHTWEDVRRILYRLGTSAEDLEDLMQQVYLAVFSSLDRFRGEAQFSTWLYAVCLRVVRRHRRSFARWLRSRGAAAAGSIVLYSLVARAA